MVKNNTKDQVMEDGLKALVEKGKERGFLTFEEMNDELPDDNISPDRLDSLLMTLDDLGIDLIDEAVLQYLE